MGLDLHALVTDVRCCIDQFQDELANDHSLCTSQLQSTIN